jgi:signal transduction histidine kinase
MKTSSLTFRLIASAALWIAVALFAGGFALSSIFRGTLEESFDRRLGALLETLVAASDIAADGKIILLRPLGDARFGQTYSGWYWQIDGGDAGGLHSRSLFDTTLSPAEPGADGTAGFGLAPGPDGQTLRIVTRDIVLSGAPRAARYSVAADTAETEVQVRRFNGTLAWSLGVLGVGLFAAVVIQVLFGLRPLRRIRAALSDIRLGRAARLEGSFPPEINPLAEELNAVLDHNAEVVERARTHVGNLAHALKTPLTVLANEAGPAAESEDNHLAANVARQTALMRRYVDHYLARARAAAAGRVIGARVDAALVVKDLRRTLEKIHVERGLAIADAGDEPRLVQGEREDVEEMIGNLMDNACKWARGRVDVSAESQEGVVRITVDDDGPGMPAEEHERVMRRGARLDESVSGSGLGLAIVADVVQLYGGALSFETSPLGGLRVILSLPAAETLPV